MRIFMQGADVVLESMAIVAAPPPPLMPPQPPAPPSSPPLPSPPLPSNPLATPLAVFPEEKPYDNLHYNVTYKMFS